MVRIKLTKAHTHAHTLKNNRRILRPKLSSLPCDRPSCEDFLMQPWERWLGNSVVGRKPASSWRKHLCFELLVKLCGFEYICCFVCSLQINSLCMLWELGTPELMNMGFLDWFLGFIPALPGTFSGSHFLVCKVYRVWPWILACFSCCCSSVEPLSLCRACISSSADDVLFKHLSHL